ncbi:hypothetical protein [Fusobacterium sp. PH5-44]|uniref:hypothetical protein n=1 Tax=unclassified Fusobacterium TaxID=2648384 RepID=UPI003D19085E
MKKFIIIYLLVLNVFVLKCNSYEKFIESGNILIKVSSIPVEISENAVFPYRYPYKEYYFNDESKVLVILPKLEKNEKGEEISIFRIEEEIKVINKEDNEKLINLLEKLKELDLEKESVLIKEDFNEIPKFKLKINQSKLLNEENSEILFGVGENKESIKFSKLYEVVIMHKIGEVGFVIGDNPNIYKEESLKALIVFINDFMMEIELNLD